MLFNSNSFYIFFPIVFTIYWLIPQKHRWGILLVSSYYFYMSWNVKYVALILLTTVVSYVTALLLDRTDSVRKKKLYLAAALVISLGVLFFFKYFNFLSLSVTNALRAISIPVDDFTLNLMLPVGISFYTFQTLSYVIDVYRGEVKATTHFGKYATFISFFPQLVAGPIERTRNLLPQIEAEHQFHYDKAIYGVKMMAWGYFKKLVIADNIAAYVNLVYDDVTAHAGLSLIIATLCFAFQVYCDFSGYSDIALGAAKLMDIDLMQNFKGPYWAGSIKEFWSRWHISLSTWFRDYVYIPLGGNRVSKGRQRFNLMVTFLTSGMWHGASWNYLLWGAIHGAGQIVENALPKKKKHYILTFLFVSFAWIFFRANTMGDVWYILTHLFSGLSEPLAYVKNGLLTFESIGHQKPFVILGAICVLMTYDYFSLKMDVIERIHKCPVVVRYTIYFLLLALVLFYRQLESYEFVYFQF